MEMWASAGLGLVAVQQQDESAAVEYYAALKTNRGCLVPEIGVDHVLALLAVCLGRLDDALDHFEMGMSWIPSDNIWHSWVSLDYAGALLQRNGPGNREKAESLLEEALDLAAKHEVMPLVDRLSRVLEDLKQVSSESPPYPDGLTQREVEVLALVAAGKSNRGIAEDLFISHNTVIRHVSNIYAKANVANRAEATAYALRNGLA